VCARNREPDRRQQAEIVGVGQPVIEQDDAERCACAHRRPCAGRVAGLHHLIAAIAEGLPVVSKLESLIRAGSQCRVMGHTMFIDHNGDIYPCCYLYNDNVWSWPERQDYLIGNWLQARGKVSNASDNALKSIWNSAHFVQMRKRSIGELPREACGRCTRHMQQNTFLDAVENALDALSASSGRERLDHALEVYDDPSNLRSRPLWL